MHGKKSKLSLTSDQFLKNNLVFFIGSLVVSFINYLYYPVVGKFLSVESFGEVQVLISFYLQLTVFLTVLGLIATNIVVNETSKVKANKLIAEFEYAAFLISIIILAGLVIIAPLLRTLLKFNSILPFIITALVFLVSVILSFRSAYLRAKLDFFAASMQGIISGITKIIISVAAILIGLKTSGAIIGLLVAQIIALRYTTRRMKMAGYSDKTDTSTLSARLKQRQLPDFTLLKPYYAYAGLVFGVSLITTIMYSFDVAVVKYLFSAKTAGQYASISTTARIIFFLTGSIAVVILSSVKQNASPSTNYKILLRSIGLTLVIGGSATLFFVLFPSFTMHLLFGARYDQLTHLLPPLSLAMLAMSLSTLIANYHIALKHKLVLLWVSTAAVVMILLIILFHAQVEQIVYDFLIGSSVLLALLIGWTGVRALPILSSNR